MRILNYLLALFGLCRLKRIKNITTELHLFYVDSVLDGIKKDFGMQYVPGYKKDAEIFWKKNFDVLFKAGLDGEVKISSERKFSDGDPWSKNNMLKDRSCDMCSALEHKIKKGLVCDTTYSFCKWYQRKIDSDGPYGPLRLAECLENNSKHIIARDSK